MAIYDQRPPEDYYPPGDNDVSDGNGGWGQPAQNQSRQVYPGSFNAIPQEAYTPRGMLWGLPLAPRWRRPAALGIDIATVLAVMAVTRAILGEGWGLLATIVFAFVSADGLLTRCGESIGKTLVGLRTVCPARYPGGYALVRPSHKQALARVALHWLDLMVFAIGLLWPFVGRWHQTWADIATGAYTIYGPDLPKVQKAPRMCQRLKL